MLIFFCRCVCVVLWKFITWIDSWKPPSQSGQSPQRNYLVLPFMATSSASLPNPWKITDLFSIFLSFWECYINWIMQYLIFWYWFSSLRIMPFRSIKVVECITSLFTYYCRVVFHCRKVPRFIHLLTKRHLSGFQFLIITKRVAINIHRQALKWT